MKNLIIESQHISVTDSIKNHINSKLKKKISKYSDLLVGNFLFTIKVDNNTFIAECKTHIKDSQIFSSNKTGNMYQSIDNTIDDIANQIQKKKDLLKNHKTLKKVYY